MTDVIEHQIISQQELDNLLQINELIESPAGQSLIAEMKRAILDSGKLELHQWESFRDLLAEIETLIPHIDLIIKLKKEEASAK